MTAENDRARLAAERLRAAVAEHAEGPDCGHPDCLFHRPIPPGQSAEDDVTVEYAHRWFEYGRWFYGFGPSMDPHVCGEDGTFCEWRERTVTVSPWSDWSRITPPAEG